MNVVSWLIVIIPVVFVLCLAFYSRRYVRDVADYLACGRVAGRYVISVGDLSAALSVISLVALVEQYYQCGIAIVFWGAVTTPLSIFLALTGYCVYRYRQTNCLSIGQFLELRYSRSFRIVAASIRSLAEMTANSIGPAVAVRFFIYFLGIPHKIPLFGLQIPTYTILVALMLAMALAILWPAGRISLLVTDCFQGIVSYPIFVIVAVFIVTKISWFSDVAPVMLDRAPGESFLNPMDISELRDFNLFALVVSIFTMILGRAAWFGNDTTNSGRTPHEQKMAGILGSWRNGFAFVMLVMIGLFVIVFMLSDRYASQSHGIRTELVKKITAEVIDEPTTRNDIHERLAQLKPPHHVIGVAEPYSRKNNPDTQFLDTTLETLREHNPDNASAVFQEVETLYGQMIMPVMLRKFFSPLLMGLFALLMVLLLLSTDDSRIFNASSTIVQDVIMPLRKTPMSMQLHLTYLRLCSLGTVVFFFIVALFFRQLDYINMFITLIVGIWVGASGPIMVGGLYTRFGTTLGAWCSLIFGSGFATSGLICQRTWAGYIYPWLDGIGFVEPVGNFLAAVSRPFNPYVVWEMNPVKFPINSVEIYFLSMVLAILGYVIGSLVSYKEPYNLDRMLHRGKYADNGKTKQDKPQWTWRRFYHTLIGITPEYTTGDKIITWSVFIWTVVYGFGIMFCGVLIWNAIAPWPAERWGTYFFINIMVVPFIVGIISTVWFLIGGIVDTRAMFRDLKKRIANPLDDGRVVDHVSLADKAQFDEIERGTERQQDNDRHP